MYWLNEVESRMKRKNQILFAKDSEFLADLHLLISEQNHRTLVLWALEFAEEAVIEMKERHPEELRLEKALVISRDWAAGIVKMPIAQRAILQAHAVAKELESLEEIALCHAIGQACGVVHTSGHAMGLPIYELTALVRRYGIPECKEAVEARKNEYIDRLFYWREQEKKETREWADFMLKGK